MWGEGGWDLELAMAILVLGFLRSCRGGGVRGPPDPLPGSDPRQQGVRGCRDRDGPRAEGVPVCGALPACTHQLKNKGNESKTGSRAGWSTNVLYSRSSKGFSTHLLVLERMVERMGVPHVLPGPFRGPL